MNVRRTDIIILAVALVNSVLWLVLGHVSYDMTPDPATYVSAWDSYLSHGALDANRTPVYPVFLGLMKWIAGDNFRLAAVLFQHLIYIISVFYFGKIASWKIASQRIADILTVFFAVLPNTVSWANCILTESLAISGMVFLFYCLCSFSRNGRWPAVVGATVWLLFLIMLRPSLIFLVPVCLLGWILFFRKKRVLACLGIVGVLLVSGLELAYCLEMKKEYGVMSPTIVSTYNQAYIAFGYGLMKPSYTDNPEYAAFIEHFDDSQFPEILYLNHKYGAATVAESVKASKVDQPGLWISAMLKQGLDASHLPVFVNYTGCKAIKAEEIVSPSIKTLFYLIILYFLALAYIFVKRHELHETSLLMWVALVGNLFLVIIGAQNEWGRLLTPTNFMVMIMICQIFNFFDVESAVSRIGAKLKEYDKDLVR